MSKHMRSIFFIFFLVSNFFILFGQENTNIDSSKSNYELKIFMTNQCFDCLVVEEEILEDPFFQTYVNKHFKITIHHSDSMLTQNDIFEKYNPDNLYPLMVMVNHLKNDFIRIPFLNQEPENLVVILSKLKR